MPQNSWGFPGLCTLASLAHTLGKRPRPVDSACSPSFGAGPAPPGWRSWWPWSCSAPPLCCTAWRSGSHSLPSAQPAPSPSETAPQPGWDTDPGRVPPRSPPLSRKYSHKNKPGEWLGGSGGGESTLDGASIHRGGDSTASSLSSVTMISTPPNHPLPILKPDSAACLGPSVCDPAVPG